MRSTSKGLFWVYDDLTFYQLLLLLKADLKKIKINFYEFQCVGFRYGGLVFKQERLRALEVWAKPKSRLCYTQGAYALFLLSQLIEEGQIVPIKITDHDKLRLRAAYSGGRNEFIADPQPGHLLYSIDFNQMYYNCLKSNFLTGDIYKTEAQTVDAPGFYHVTYESIGMKYPILYVRNPINEQNYFCNGRGEGLFWFEELLLFCKYGGLIHRIHYAYKGRGYIRNFLAFTDVIDTSPDKKLKKALANNLYGKLAMKDFFYKCTLLTEEEFLIRYETGQVKKWRKWYDFYICEDVSYSNHSAYTDICAAAAITSKARIRLYELLNALEDFCICLLNTDEIIVSAKGPIRLAPNFDVKIKQITFEEFLTKKNLFGGKRKIGRDGTTTPYTLTDGMLI